MIDPTVPPAPLSFDSAPDTQPARTHPGDRGPAVVNWQTWLQNHGYSIGKVDGIHGARTEAASLAYERAQTNPPPPAPSTPGVDEPFVSEFIQARNYTPANRTRMDWVVMHSTEPVPVTLPSLIGVARNTALFFAGQQPDSKKGSSSHYVVGPEITVQCVREQHVAWAAPYANRTGIQVEQVGWAALTDWARAGDDARAGRAVLERSARLVAAICRRWGIPVERCGPTELLAGKRGITTHAAVDDAFHGSTHQDPGLQGDRRWPWDDFLALVAAS